MFGDICSAFVTGHNTYACVEIGHCFEYLFGQEPGKGIERFTGGNKSRIGNPVRGNEVNAVHINVFLVERMQVQLSRRCRYGLGHGIIHKRKRAGSGKK